MLADQKWDAVKLDGCSQFHNTSLWANLMEETGRPIAIENCNNEVRNMPWLAFVRELSMLLFDCQLNLMLEPRHTAPTRSGSKS